MSILDKIVAKTKELVEVRKSQVSPDVLISAAAGRSFNDFAKALRKSDGSPAIISELKKASPSKGLIRENFRPLELAVELEKAGASALSVLTEPYFFLGAPEYLQAARRVCQLPILRKDFMVDSYQLLEAAAWGADAILLIATSLDDEIYKRLYFEARELGLSVLTEVHNQQELDRVLAIGAQIVGVNARNLKTFAVDLDVTAQMMADIPQEIVRVAESGIRNAADIIKLQKAGADAFLIGETVMRHSSPGQALQELLTGVKEG